MAMMVISMRISMGVSMVIGGSADNTNANAARIVPNASAGVG